MSNAISEFLKHDDEKIEKLISEYPINVPVNAVAAFLGVDDESIRAAVECGNFGYSWRKAGKMNKCFKIPTAQLLRWYMHS
ncbi:MAG: hypothetical protein MJZ03_05375 [archaeon]|jgi:type II restriction/modification system DNA methylase subunit YeeA|nr:hypothetical protein [archaeon]